MAAGGATRAEQDALVRRLENLSTLVDASRAMASERDPDALLFRIIGLTSAALGADRATLFLLDADLKIGTIHSDATAQLFQRESVSGITFEDLLRDLVTPKTLAIATKFVKVLWSERTKENLIRSINPLNEVEILVGEKGSKDANPDATGRVPGGKQDLVEVQRKVGVLRDTVAIRYSVAK